MEVDFALVSIADQTMCPGLLCMAASLLMLHPENSVTIFEFAEVDVQGRDVTEVEVLETDTLEVDAPKMDASDVDILLPHFIRLRGGRQLAANTKQ
jgi:hypothetical protein